jgi:predicted nuclease of predicted toxin-antitoxin system
MRFLLDQDVFSATGRFLIDLGHDAVPVAKLGLARASDLELLRIAHAENRIFVTRDRDFGNLVFLQQLGAGVIYLRMLPSTQKTVHEELRRVLQDHSESELARTFVVVEPGRHRIRKLAT